MKREDFEDLLFDHLIEGVIALQEEPASIQKLHGVVRNIKFEYSSIKESCERLLLRPGGAVGVIGKGQHKKFTFGVKNEQSFGTPEEDRATEIELEPKIVVKIKKEAVTQANSGKQTVTRSKQKEPIAAPIVAPIVAPVPEKAVKVEKIKTPEIARNQNLIQLRGPNAAEIRLKVLERITQNTLKAQMILMK